MRVGLAQHRHLNQDPKKAISSAEEIAEKSNADIVIFPEIFISGYVVNEGLLRIAREWERNLGAMKKIAEERGRALIFGMPRLVDGFIRNSSIFVSPSGDVVAYDKMHLVNFGPFREALYMHPGEEPKIVEYRGWRIGLAICYDLFFPELYRYYALKGADAVVNISASPNTSRYLFENLITARAVENTMFHVYVNWGGGGYLEGMTWWGGSRAVSPRGRILVRGPYYREAVLEVDLDKEELGTARLNRMSLRDSFLVWGRPSDRRQSGKPSARSS